jgi:hypothetical protein
MLDVLIPAKAYTCAEGGHMTLALGKWETLARKHGTFGGYDVRGDWVADAQLKRAWLIHLSGLNSGSFAVCDGEIRRAGWEYFAGPSGGTSGAISPDIADLGASAKKAIFDAITKWETEEQDKPLYL